MWEHFLSTPLWIYLNPADLHTRASRPAPPWWRLRKAGRFSAPTFYPCTPVQLTPPFNIKQVTSSNCSPSLILIVWASTLSSSQNQPGCDYPPCLAQTEISPRSLDVNVDVLVLRSGGYICNMCQGVFCAWFNANLLWPTTLDSNGTLLQGQWRAMAVSKISFWQSEGGCLPFGLLFRKSVLSPRLFILSRFIWMWQMFIMQTTSFSKICKPWLFPLRKILVCPPSCTGTVGWLYNESATAWMTWLFFNVI